MNRLETLGEQLIWTLKDNSAAVKLSLVLQKLPDLNYDLDDVLSLAKEWGYQIDQTESELKLIASPDKLIDTEIKYKLSTSFIGQNIHAYQSVLSTNDIATSLAEANLPEGTLVIAEEQKRGRGRMGRIWHSPQNGNAYLSLILRPTLRAGDAPGLAIITALALAETVNEYLPNQVNIKWPNDLLLNGKKTAGILTELQSEQDKINFVIVGIGININVDPNVFPEDIKALVTSISHENGEPINRIELIRKFLSRFESLYLSYQNNLLHPHLDKIKSYSFLLGKKISFQKKDVIFEGMAIDISANGNLVVDVNGAAMSVNSGEVTIVKR